MTTIKTKYDKSTNFDLATALINKVSDENQRLRNKIRKPEEMKHCLFCGKRMPVVK